MWAKVALVRHPAVSGAHGRCYGRLDLPLADPNADIALIVSRLRNVSSPEIHTSPALRCRIIVGHIGAIAHIDPRLQELDFGRWEGCMWDEVPRADLDRWAADPLGFAPPGGESGAELLARVSEFRNQVLTGSRNCIVVTHGGPLKILLPLLRGLEPDLLAPAPGLGSVTILDAPDTE